jgi:hypothetical protein
MGLEIKEFADKAIRVLLTDEYILGGVMYDFPDPDDWTDEEWDARFEATKNYIQARSAELLAHYEENA